MSIWEIISKYFTFFGYGITTTLFLAIVGILGGLFFGLFLALGRTLHISSYDHFIVKIIKKVINFLCYLYIQVFRGTPMVLQAVFIYYGLPYFTDGAILWTSVWACAILVVSINTGAYMAETVRGGILSIDRGQTEGAKAIGMNHFQTMLYVILPQTLRNILPQIGNNFIINIKDTSVMFIISFTDLFAVHRAVVGRSFLYFPSATIEMIAYLTLTLISSFILRFWEKKLAGSSSYELATSDALSPTAGILNSPLKGSNFDEQHIETKEGK